MILQRLAQTGGPALSGAQTDAFLKESALLA